MIALFADAGAEAHQLNHQWVGAEHLLLAILRDDRPSSAQHLLVSLGANHDSYSENLRRSLLNCTPPVRSDLGVGSQSSWTPVLHRVEGWSHGYAAASARPMTAEVALLGLCVAAPWPVAFQVDRELVLRDLRGLGLPLPAGAHEQATERPMHILSVAVDQLDAVLLVLRANREVGFQGFNIDKENDHAYVVVANPAAARKALPSLR